MQPLTATAKAYFTVLSVLGTVEDTNPAAKAACERARSLSRDGGLHLLSQAERAEHARLAREVVAARTTTTQASVLKSIDLVLGN
jgi:hypothetical protein